MKETGQLTLKKDKKKSAATMTVAVLVAPGKFELQESEIPEIDDDELLIKLQGCGICSSGIPLWQGREWFNYPVQPGTPGHEGWGVVEQTGSSVLNFKKGDRVAFLSDKSFAQFDKCKSTEAVKLHDDLIHFPFPGEALGCAANIFSRSDIRAGQTVAIVGIGFLGLCLVQLAKMAGAKIISISRRDSSLKSAMDAGSDFTIKMNDHWKIIEDVKSITKNYFCDRVIECTGKQWPLDLSSELVSEDGKLIIAGYHQDGIRNVNMQMWNWKGIDVINAHERKTTKYVTGMEKAVDFVRNDCLSINRLITHKFPMNKINEAFTMLEKCPENFIKAVIEIE